MSKFGKLDKKQVALVLSLASVLGGKASGINNNKSDVKSSQTLGAVGGATVSNNNSGANPKTLKRSNSMTGLTRKMSIGTKAAIGAGCVVGAVVLANEGAGLLTNADTWYKGRFSFVNAARHFFGGDNMKPEEKQALATKILDVINTFDIQKIGKLKLPKYKGDELKDKAKEDYDKKYDENCNPPVKECIDVDRVKVERYMLDGLMGGVTPVFDKYRALRVFYNGNTDSEILGDLKSWDFKKKYNEHDVKEITFAKNRIRINYGCGDFSSFELQEDGKLKVNFIIDNYKAGKKLITEFTLEKPKK